MKMMLATSELVGVVGGIKEFLTHIKSFGIS